MRDLQATAEALLADLVGFPSVTGTPNGAIVGYIKDYLEELNIPVSIRRA
jgi:acetylornithine deacetylase/succinyl-diaminopimelate desuccinylase-like protein